MTTSTKFRATCAAGVTFTPDQIHVDADSISIWCDFKNCPSKGDDSCPCTDGDGFNAVFITLPKGGE